MEGRIVWKALMGWSDHAVKMARVRDYMLRAEARWGNVTAGGAFDGWRAFHFQRKMVKHATCRVLHKLSGRAFSQWLSWHAKEVSATHDARHASLCAARAAAHQAFDRHKEKAGALLLAKRLMSVLHACVVQWKEQHRRQSARKRLQLRCIFHMRVRLLWRALSRWNEHATKCIRVRAFLLRAEARWSNATVGAAFSGWRAHHVRQRMASRAARRVLHKLSAGAFARWRSAHAEQAAARRGEALRASYGFTVDSLAQSLEQQKRQAGAVLFARCARDSA
jgi:hypothetical protein